MYSRLIVVGNVAAPTATEVYHDLLEALQKGEVASDLGFIDATEGISKTLIATDPEKALREAVISVRSAEEANLVVLGLNASPTPSFSALSWNLDLAAHAGCSVVFAIDAEGLGASSLAHEIENLLRCAKKSHATVAGIAVDGARGLDIPDFGVPVLYTPFTADQASVLIGVKPVAVTPLAFQANLLERASANKQRIVLPESEDDRILQAVAELQSQDVADIILLGDAAAVAKRAEELNLDISSASVVSTDDAALADKYAAELARLREAKGVTLEQARQMVADKSYFATMMVQMGDADGMVSGATHTTAETIRPALQIIKTAPDAGLVSSAFLMLLPDRVIVFADCAVNVDPDADQLAKIAVTSAQTAKTFDVDPKVAMLSYSTLGSGSGPSVDKVTAATAKVREIDPDLAVEGPIQFDAAVDESVGASKAPGSPVAGAATVLVFPNLDSGNIAYKAVQREAGAVAVGPVLQGLRKPVNDLSRGATVADIVNTVAITAVQAAAGQVSGDN